MIALVNSKQARDYKGLREYIYTPIETAVRLLDDRKELILPDIEMPDFLKAYFDGLDNPYQHTAIIFRQIASPNFEMRRVIELCEEHHLNLLVLTIKEDKFSTRNLCKYALGRMGFFEGIGRRGGKKISYKNIIDFNKYDGSLLRECNTFRGQSFMEFHHNLLLGELPQLSANNMLDCSEWFLKQNQITNNWYTELLKIFLKHAIFLETFVLSGSELGYTLTKVVPAIQEMIDRFGIKPLIVRSDPQDAEGDEYWQLYPEHLQLLAPYDRRRTPRYDAPFDKFMPVELRASRETRLSKKTNKL